MSRFPEGSLWGAVCASCRCEGGWDTDARGPNIRDERCHDIAGRRVKTAAPATWRAKVIETNGECL